MISVSSIFFGCRGTGIYESVEKADSLGFEGVELRQEHLPKNGVWKILKKTKADFPNIEFTIHAPLWSGSGINYLNPAMGLTGKNKKLLEDVFRGVQIVEAKVVLFHTGFTELLLFNHIAWVPRIHWPRLKMPRGIAKKGFGQFMESAVKIAGDIGTEVLVENPPPSKLDVLLNSKEDFATAFSDVKGLGLALDMSHSFARGELAELLTLRKKIREIHVAYSKEGEEDMHLPASMEHLQPLKKLPQLKELPIVLEHGREVSLDELIKEKAVVEKFLKSI